MALLIHTQSLAEDAAVLDLVVSMINLRTRPFWRAVDRFDEIRRPGFVGIRPELMLPLTEFAESQGFPRLAQLFASLLTGLGVDLSLTDTAGILNA